MEINFLITEQSVNDMDIVDYEAFERAQDGDVKLYRLRPAITRFMVDKDNKPIPFDEAIKVSSKLKVKDMKNFIQKFFEVMKQSAVPKANGDLSKSPLEVPSAV